MYTSRDENQRKQINAFMTQFQEHAQAWTRVDAILERTQCEQSKFFALATLEHCVKYRWKVLPADQREAIKAYIVNVIVRYSSDEQILQRTKLHLGKLNLILVQVRHFPLCIAYPSEHTAASSLRCASKLFSLGMSTRPSPQQE